MIDPQCQATKWIKNMETKKVRRVEGGRVGRRKRDLFSLGQPPEESLAAGRFSGHPRLPLRMWRAPPTLCLLTGPKDH